MAANFLTPQLGVTTAQITDSTAAGRSLLTAADAAAQRALLSQGVTKIAEGNFASAATLNISVPSGYKYYKLLCRNMTHSHTAASRFRVRFFNNVTAQTVRQYTTAVTDVAANATYGLTLNGQNADLELDCDFHGTYNRAVHARYTTHRSATTVNYPQSAPLSATQDYASRLEASIVVDVFQIGWTLGNIGATGDWILYGYN